MKVSRVLFLSLGLGHAYPRRDRQRTKGISEKLVEPEGARLCRRNIVAIGGVVVLAGLVGADPRDLVIFGIRPTTGRGMIFLGSAVFLAHVYWYVLRYCHLRDDGMIDRSPEMVLQGAGPEHAKISWNEEICLVRRGADRFSNWVAFSLTILSWYFIVLWIATGNSS